MCQAPMLAPRLTMSLARGGCLDAEPSATGAGVGLAHLAGLLAACPTLVVTRHRPAMR